MINTIDDIISNNVYLYWVDIIILIIPTIKA